MTNANDSVLSCSRISKSYRQGRNIITVLENVDLNIKAAERIAIVGTSGSGKTTLLNLLGGLDLPTSGNVTVAGKNLNNINDSERGLLRNEYLGFVFQFHHLLGEFTALENVAMPLFINGRSPQEAAASAEVMLERVGLGSRFSHKPSELSGGERQRVAIARALVNTPKCVLLDEPTGNLDKFTAGEIQSLLIDLNDSFDTSFIVVTHDELMANSMHRKLVLEGGTLHE
jgi:lipoprotein-releasing system ATP-binding protein